MTTIDPHLDLATLVTTHPELASELDRRGFDYCCGGGATLADACRAAGVDVDEVSDALAAVADAPAVPEWAELDMVALVEHIEGTHHRYLWDELPLLVELATKVRSVHADRHPELVDVELAVAALRADLEPHLRKEEMVLFPMIRELETSEEPPAFHCGSLANPISVMLAEHDTTGELLARMRDLTGGYRAPDDACASYAGLYQRLERIEADTHLHVLKENSRLFPMVVARESELAGTGGSATSATAVGRPGGERR